MLTVGSGWDGCGGNEWTDHERANARWCLVSYSREDENWRGRFTEMLKSLVRERRLEVWSDDRMVTGY